MLNERLEAMAGNIHSALQLGICDESKIMEFVEGLGEEYGAEKLAEAATKGEVKGILKKLFSVIKMDFKVVIDSEGYHDDNGDFYFDFDFLTIRTKKGQVSMSGNLECALEDFNNDNEIKSSLDSMGVEASKEVIETLLGLGEDLFELKGSYRGAFKQERDNNG